MMAAILNYVMLDSDTAILDSDTLLSSLRFTQKYSHSILTLTQTNSIWFKLFHFHLIWWRWPSWVWQSWIQQSLYFLSNSLTLANIGFHQLHKKNFTHSFWLNLMMAAILNSAILAGFSHFPQKNFIHSFLTQLDDDSHLEFYHLEFGHLEFWPSWYSAIFTTHSDLPRLIPTICTQYFTHSFSLKLMIAAILNSAMLDSDTAILDSDTLLSSLRFTQKHSHSTLTLTQTNSIWLKLFHFQLTWWWQPSGIMPS